MFIIRSVIYQVRENSNSHYNISNSKLIAVITWRNYVSHNLDLTTRCGVEITFLYFIKK